MENRPYIYLGFNLWKAALEKKRQEVLRELRIDIPQFSYDANDMVLSMVIRVEIDYSESKDNKLLYIAGFQINDDELKRDLSLDDKKNEYIPLFVRIVFPFIRENVATITKDTGNPIMLPIIDCQELSYDTVLVLEADRKSVV